MNPQALERSARNLLASVIADGQWLPPLEAMMAEMNVLGGGIARVVPPRMFAIPTSGVREQFADMQAGRAPTLTKETPLTPGIDDGFLADHTCRHKAVRERTAFHQEFLRPRGCAHYVAAFLDATPMGTVKLLAFRPEREGIFREDELAAFDRLLPYLRAAAMVSRASLQDEARRQAEPFERRGEPVLYLDADGRVVEVNDAGERADRRLFGIVDRRVTTLVPGDQARLDRALKGALASGKPGLVNLTVFSGSGQAMALVVPVHGHARDVFEAVSALVVLLDPGHRIVPYDRSFDLLRDAADLTGREFEVVRLVASGSAPREAAESLGIAFGTTRLHLKAAFAKLGVHSQAELSALARRLG